MDKLRLAMVGGGSNSLVGVLHRIASSMFDNYTLLGGVFSSDWNKNKEFAKSIGLKTDRIYKDFDAMIEEELKLPKDKRIQVVSILTPNFLHFPTAKKLIENDIHVICEKPLTTSYNQAKQLLKVIEKNPVIFALTHTYTGYSMVRQMREMVKKDAIGSIQKVDVQYYQGWINPIIHHPEKHRTTWRLDPEKSGVSCCLADIGTHAFNMIEYVSGLRVKNILADINYLYQDNPMDIDVSVLVKFSQSVKGTIRSSQIATGEENNLQVHIYGRKGALKWEQENPNKIIFMEEGKETKYLTPGHPYNTNFSLQSTKLPAWTSRRYFDAMGNIYNGVAKAIFNQDYNEGAFPTLTEGIRGMDFIEKAIKSHKSGNIWVEIN